jgi:hypothetical protein
MSPNALEKRYIYIYIYIYIILFYFIYSFWRLFMYIFVELACSICHYLKKKQNNQWLIKHINSIKM